MASAAWYVFDRDWNWFGTGLGHRMQMRSKNSLTSFHDIPSFPRATATNSFNDWTLITPPAAMSASAFDARASFFATACCISLQPAKQIAKDSILAAQPLKGM